MSRKIWLWLIGFVALVGLAAMAPAVAQFALPSAAPPPPPPQAPHFQVRPQVARPIPQVSGDSNAATLQPWMNPDTAKAAIQKLQADRRKLREQYQLTLTEYQKTLAKLDEMTRVGGSLVTAHCEGLVSVNTAGASENCESSGYACNAVSGLCERSCHGNSGTECAGGYVCDGGQCIVPVPHDDG